MNKQELIDKYEAAECVVNFVSGKTLLKSILRDLKQLDEQKPVKVPQCVADWIEYLKKCSGTLYGSTVPFLYYGRAIADNFEGDVTEILRWIRNDSETYARAWLDGYEVEKEKRYTVVMEATKQPLYYNAGDKKLFFSTGGLATNFTRKQLEDAGFGWVFDCEGVEVKESEDE